MTSEQSLAPRLEDAATSFGILIAIEVYDRLVIERGWWLDDWERWGRRVGGCPITQIKPTAVCAWRSAPPV